MHGAVRYSSISCRVDVGEKYVSRGTMGWTSEKECAVTRASAGLLCRRRNRRERGRRVKGEFVSRAEKANSERAENARSKSERLGELAPGKAKRKDRVRGRWQESSRQSSQSVYPEWKPIGRSAALRCVASVA